MYEITDQYLETLHRNAHRILKQTCMEHLGIAYDKVLESADLKHYQGVAALRGAEEVQREILYKILNEFKDNL